MPRILVIADDLSGAAEIAGIGWRFGLSVSVVRDEAETDTREQLIVIDTDSRLLPVGQAAERVATALGRVELDKFDLVYKKIDSVMRGPVRAEIEAALEATGKSSALLIPANPSRGRTIREGQYFVNDVPLDQTDFAKDVDFPARSVSVAELLGGTPTQNIIVGDAAAVEDMRQAASRVDASVLPVGGADFFTALLELRGLVAQASRKSELIGSALFVCGSASEPSRQAVQSAIASGTRVCGMRNDMDLWEREIDGELAEQQRAILAILQPPVSNRAQSSILCDKLAEIVQRMLVARYGVAELLVEGGATASAIARRMGWKRFRARDEIAAGVVRLSVVTEGSPPFLTIKPGSYPWPAELWNPSSRTSTQ